jgi:hypothetical protein
MIQRRQKKMRHLLANEIYLKSLAVKAILALRNHREGSLKMNGPLLTKQTKGKVGGLTYLLNYEIKQFDERHLHPLSTTSNAFKATTGHTPTKPIHITSLEGTFSPPLCEVAPASSSHPCQIESQRKINIREFYAQKMKLKVVEGWRKRVRWAKVRKAVKSRLEKR